MGCLVSGGACNWLALGPFLVALSCAGRPSPTCVAGDQKGCACRGAAEGVQVCESHGRSYGSCDCPSAIEAR